MVWPFLMAFSALITVIAWLVGNGNAARCAFVILLGISAIRVALALPVSHSYDILLISAIWVVMAALIPRQVAGGDTTSLIVRVFLVMNGMTGLWAKVTDAPRVFGSAPYVAGDLLLIAAMLLIGWSLRHDVSHRLSDIGNGIHSVVGNHSVRRGGPARGGDDLARDSEGKAAYPQEVSENG